MGCIGEDLDDALLKAMLSVGHRIPRKGVLISSGDAGQKSDMLQASKLLAESGLKIYATKGTCKFLTENGIHCLRALWPSEVAELSEGNTTEVTAAPAALDLIQNHTVDLVITIPKNFSHRELTNGYYVRRAAIDFNVPLITNSRLATAYIIAFHRRPQDKITI